MLRTSECRKFSRHISYFCSKKLSEITKIDYERVWNNKKNWNNKNNKQKFKKITNKNKIKTFRFA